MKVDFGQKVEVSLYDHNDKRVADIVNDVVDFDGLEYDYYIVKPYPKERYKMYRLSEKGEKYIVLDKLKDCKNDNYAYLDQAITQPLSEKEAKVITQNLNKLN